MSCNTKLTTKDKITIGLAVGGLVCLAFNETSVIGLLLMAASVFRCVGEDS